MATLKFGLNIQKKQQKVPNRPAPAKRKPIFDEEDEDDESSHTTKSSNGAEEIGVFDLDEPKPKPKPPIASPKTASQPKPSKLASAPTLKQLVDDDPTAGYGDLSTLQTSMKHAEDALAVDPSIYDYDAAYDAIHTKTAAKAAAEREDAVQRRPRYMEKVMESAEVRKRDQLRAKDKLLQREREAEGDEFADKEKFVTEAYKAQQEEVRKAEEEEKARQELEEKKRKGKGMTGFYRQIMDEDEERHRAAMEAASLAGKAGVQKVEEAPKEKSEADIAKELNQKGGKIIINEEGQVADKRQLLTAGLNVVAKPKAATAASTTAARPGGLQPGYKGREGVQRSVRERQSKMMEEQLEQAAKRAADDEAEERRKLEHTSKSRKTDSDISGAKERYLQRKREAAAAAAAGKGS
ncbi:hypothetical protein BU16DRAFT_310965 [Lophium mytilinum]|uniref:Nuclear speckle splicing regulatory protein 1 N-terminal domain-containing protein n=1 Tax=Lophium mytilinum TaxID=390894 RepID=A0A6A6R0D3_9PEZI|nr:hypothetical protein BU16DRAFT_310965 [Lophium mytilinum]